MTSDPQVRAAGGVVHRAGPDGVPHVLVVHRPRYDDWSLPKGKADAGETDEDCARREVWEETGFSVEVGAEIGSVRYVDHKGRSKIVRYWAMVPTAGSFVENDEVDEARWLPVPEAVALVSYERDQAVLEAFGRLNGI